MTESYFSRLPELSSFREKLSRAGSLSFDGTALPQELLLRQPHLAIQYLERAAKEEHSVALDLLGMLYATGQFLPEDPQRAVGLFKRAAEQNDPEACFHLAMALREGFGCAKNLSSSFAWLRVASKKGEAQATFALAQSYEKGLGCEVNAPLAKKFYVEAANRGEKQAIERLIDLEIDSNPLRPKELLKWLKKASDEAIPRGLLAIAKKNLEDDPKNVQKSIELLEEGARQSDGGCCLELATLWFDNRFVPRDLVSSIVYCHLASTHGSWLAKDLMDQLRPLASAEDLGRAAEIASYPTPSLVISALKQRRTESR